jgi:putative hemolysin
MLAVNPADPTPGTDQAPAYPPAPESRPDEVLTQGRYRVRYASTEAELDAILELRYRIFNVELHEGLESSHATGRDEDPFDRYNHHLLVEDTKGGGIVGTYRIQTAAMAAAGLGFYSGGEFALEQLPSEIVTQSVEVGRACISLEHRNRQVLFLLWKGLARYMAHNRKRYLFGCCSLTTQDPADGLAALSYLTANGFLHPTHRAPPRPGFECAGELPAAESVGELELPILFRTYLRYRALVCGPPAIDREFKTIDFLILFDIDAMDPRSRELFFT